jgi:hypothetical protein
MAHCPPELLDDLADVLARLRTWASVVERKPGVFYALGQPFFHFHLVNSGQRRGDIKGRAGWVQLDLPRPISVAKRRALSRELRARYAERVPRVSATARPARMRRPSPERKER